MKGEELQKAATVTGHEEGFKMNFKLPVYGEYGINVYASRHSDPDRLYHIHTYFVKCRVEEASKNEVSQKTGKTKFMFVEEDSVSVELSNTYRRNIIAQLRRKHVRKKRVKAKEIEIRCQSIKLMCLFK